MTSLEVRPSPKPRIVIAPDGALLAVPADWILVPPGDAALSRRLKAATPTYTVVERKGNKKFSRGIWASASVVESLQAALRIERADPSHARKLEQGRARRASQQTEYVEDFKGAVLAFLSFHSRYQILASDLAARIAAHATPVGSGTVARTQRIPIQERAQAATIAWMRHQTTAYDHLVIPRERGKRREVRRLLAKRSSQLLDTYRKGTPNLATCPLQAAMRR